MFATPAARVALACTLAALMTSAVWVLFDAVLGAPAPVTSTLGGAALCALLGAAAGALSCAPGPDRPDYFGISTVSTTWMTPLLCFTSGIVTIDLPPLASMISSLPPAIATFSVSP